MGNTVGVLLAGGTSLFRAYVRLVIEGRPQFRVVGEAFSAPIAMAIAKQKRPNLVLLDCRGSTEVFVEAIRKVTYETGGACLLVRTADQASIVSERDRELGVEAVVMKDDDPRDLIRHLEGMCR